MAGDSIDRRTALMGGAISVATLTQGSGLSEAAPNRCAEPIGARGDGVVDDSLVLQAAYDALARAGGGVLVLPRGIFRAGLEMTSRRVSVQGAGRGVTILRPVAPDATVLRALYREGSWDGVEIADLSIEGLGTRRGTGLSHGAVTYQRGDEYVGRTALTRVGFSNLQTCVARPYGNIGLWVDNCTFAEADYHLWGRSRAPGGGSDAMHGGNVIVTRSHFSAFFKASLYLDSPVGDAGQIVFENNIFELAPGFVAFIRAFSTGPVPGLIFRRNWNEQTATGRNVEIDGVRHAQARFIHATDCAAPIVLEDTPPGPVTLRNAQLETRGCALDLLTMADLDSRSSLRHSDARQGEGLAPGQCATIAGPTRPNGLRTPWFRMPAPRHLTSAYGQHVLLRADSTQPIAFAGSRSLSTRPAQGDAALPDRAVSQDLVLQAGEQLFVDSPFKVAAGDWLALVYLYRLIAGKPSAVQLNGRAGLSGRAILTSPSWEMLVNISENPGPAVDAESLWHFPEGGSSILRIGGFAVLAFRDRQSAIEFANSGLFPA